MVKKDRHLIGGEELKRSLPTIIQHVCGDCGSRHSKYLYMEKGKLIIKTFRDDFVTKQLKDK